MTQKNLNEYKRKYDVVKHHAWAGSVLLAVLVAIRGFFEISDIKIDEYAFTIESVNKSTDTIKDLEDYNK